MATVWSLYDVGAKCILVTRAVRDVISRMPNAKVFSVLDADHGFWPVKDTERVKFIVDDLVVWGGHVEQHETRLGQANKEKNPFPVSQVRYVGHVLSSGIKLDPQKVEAINAKLTPGNCKDLQRFLGLKRAISSAPVLTFCDSKDPVTLSVDASSKALEILSHEIPDWPWAKIAADLFQFKGKDHLVTIDLYSNFFEVDHEYSMTSEAIIKKLKAHIPRHGVPDD
ncbi:hypothetical protein P5673_018622 [Acropora cervicornis]|uniref:Polyprotein n=1 Tax=Acropora cervicornis TaxID=6130 RepID=A0AAD9V2M1_ACRCE|nr:hypothetical protein P5673_018622 [Acropora cervicornis]